ncbi:phage tail protein [Photorhabdus sp. APURE]|uniref:phage tail protein n=1 Tax=Photorhabdus aballayi TaxID=2991723 RepID=UPI00223D93F2|nr:phage tail protein [Photorhabdus aballayi]MCW7549198.1 phage tail protein [Photorhabdus aballayi]
MSIKASLLKTKNTVMEVELFETKVNLRRLSAAELLDQEEAVQKASDEGDIRKASLLNIQLIIDCLVDKTGKKLPVDEVPTADELLMAHDNVALLDAIAKVKRHSIGTLEEAEKN